MEDDLMRSPRVQAHADERSGLAVVFEGSLTGTLEIVAQMVSMLPGDYSTDLETTRSAPGQRDELALLRQRPSWAE